MLAVAGDLPVLQSLAAGAKDLPVRAATPLSSLFSYRSVGMLARRIHKAKVASLKSTFTHYDHRISA
jgi:hypothetical protein